MMIMAWLYGIGMAYALTALNIDVFEIDECRR